MLHSQRSSVTGTVLRDIAVLALSLAAASCTSSVNHTFKDQGEICLFPAGVDPGSVFLPPQQALSFRADSPVQVRVQAPTCLSGSCSHNLMATCTAALKGNVIEVTSAASYVEEGNTCTLDCKALVASCTTPPLPAGTYQVRHGADTITVTVPAMVVPPCAGRAF